MDASARETQTIRRISEELEALPIEQRRFVAGFAYVLARAAHADLAVSDAELGYMEEAVVEVGQPAARRRPRSSSRWLAT